MHWTRTKTWEITLFISKYVIRQSNLSRTFFLLFSVISKRYVNKKGKLTQIRKRKDNKIKIKITKNKQRKKQRNIKAKQRNHTKPNKLKFNQITMVKRA